MLVDVATSGEPFQLGSDEAQVSVVGPRAIARLQLLAEIGAGTATSRLPTAVVLGLETTADLCAVAASRSGGGAQPTGTLTAVVHSATHSSGALLGLRASRG